MWQKPSRSSTAISQTYNDGIVSIYDVTNSASPGLKPVEVLTLSGTYRFEERRLGIQRFYMSMQNQIEIERIIRLQKIEIHTKQIAIIDGVQYRIDLVQIADVYPRSLDLTLTKIEQEYDHMIWYEKLINCLVSVGGNAVSHNKQLKNSSRYIVWAEESTNDFKANMIHAEKAVTGYIDLFTKTEFDVWKEQIESALDANGIAYSDNGCDYEEDTGFYHYQWEFQIFHG